MKLLHWLLPVSLAQIVNTNVNTLPRFGNDTFKFTPLADDFCDEVNINPCFSVMKPASFNVSLTTINSLTVLNGFSTTFQERLNNGTVTN